MVLVFIITKLATVVIYSNQCALAFYYIRIILHFIMRLTPEQRLQIVQLYYHMKIMVPCVQHIVLLDSFMVFTGIQNFKSMFHTKNVYYTFLLYIFRMKNRFKIPDTCKNHKTV